MVYVCLLVTFLTYSLRMIMIVATCLGIISRNKDWDSVVGMGLVVFG